MTSVLHAGTIQAGDLVRCSLAGEVLVYAEAEWCTARNDGKALGLIAPAAGPRDVEPAPAPELTVAQAQAMLRDLGYDPGPIDGAWGPRTRAALQAFMASRGMAGGDRLGDAARRMLNLAWRRQSGAGG